MNIELTEGQALNIRHWRVINECSFGRVSELVWEHYPELRPMVAYSNSIVGRDLCYVAMTLLNEEVEDGWN